MKVNTCNWIVQHVNKATVMDVRVKTANVQTVPFVADA